MKKLVCFLIGHDDPILYGIGIVKKDALYRLWRDAERSCRRCGKKLGPANPTSL